MRITPNFILRQLEKHGFKSADERIAIYRNQRGYSINTRIVLSGGSFDRDKFYECARDMANQIKNHDFSIYCTMSSAFEYATCNITLTRKQ